MPLLSRLRPLLAAAILITALGAVRPGLYVNSDGSPLIPLILSATHSLNIEIYEMNDPDVRAAIRKVMRDPARSVWIRVVKEPKPVGASCRVFEPPKASGPRADTPDCADQKALYAEIIARGGRYEPFSHEAFCPPKTNCFEHGKMVVADHALALISTGNFNPTSLCNKAQHPDRCNRDYSVVTSDVEAVGALERVFDSDTNKIPFDAAEVLSPDAAKKVTVSPHSRAPLLGMIEAARSTIDIENQYLKDREMNAAILAAAERGIRIRITLAGLCSLGKPTQSEIRKARALYTPLDANPNITLRFFTNSQKIEGLPGYMHAKAIVVDSELPPGRAWVGSVNGSATAMDANREFGLFIYDKASLNRLMDIMAKDNQGGETLAATLSCAN